MIRAPGKSISSILVASLLICSNPSVSVIIFNSFIVLLLYTPQGGYCLYCFEGAKVMIVLFNVETRRATSLRLRRMQCGRMPVAPALGFAGALNTDLYRLKKIIPKSPLWGYWGNERIWGNIFNQFINLFSY
jgi:hypothetical protein